MLGGFLRYRLFDVDDPGKIDSSLKGYRSFMVSPPVRLSVDNAGNVMVFSFVPVTG
jgi:hypothetical protein